MYQPSSNPPLGSLAFPSISQVFRGETKQPPSIAELFKKAVDFEPMYKISLNIEAEEFTPATKPDTFLNPNPAKSVLDIPEFTPSAPASSLSPKDEPLPAESEPALGLAEEKLGSGKYEYSIEEITGCFNEFFSSEGFKQIDKGS
jgi:hypothetical protein